jgi:hypothetical protein
VHAPDSRNIQVTIASGTVALVRPDLQMVLMVPSFLHRASRHGGSRPTFPSHCSMRFQLKWWQDRDALTRTEADRLNEIAQTVTLSGPFQSQRTLRLANIGSLVTLLHPGTDPCQTDDAWK